MIIGRRDTIWPLRLVPHLEQYRLRCAFSDSFVRHADARSAFFQLSFFMSKLSKLTASTARHACPESKFCRSTQFSVHCLGTKASPLSLLRASELMTIMMESPRPRNLSPSFDTRHGTVSVQESSSSLIAFWHFAPWPWIVVLGLPTAESRPYSERTPNPERLHLVSKIDTLVRKLASPSISL
jgi:hypothetical protein